MNFAENIGCIVVYLLAYVFHLTSIQRTSAQTTNPTVGELDSQ